MIHPTVKKLFIPTLIAMVLLVLSGCRSFSALVELEEIDQQVSAQDEFREMDLKEDKIPGLVGMIKEIEVIRGEQKFIYVNLGKNRKGYKKGLYAYIYNDAERKVQVGKCVVVEVYSKLSKLQIVELNYSIVSNGVVYVEVDPRYLIKK